MGFPLIIQHDASDCGPAALSMIAAFYDKRISIARFRELAGTNRQGTTLAGLLAAADRAGFKAQAVRATTDALRRIPLPAIAHWLEDNRAHFVVIYKLGKRAIRIADPAKGRRLLAPDEFARMWTGALLLLTPSVQLQKVIASKSPTRRVCSLLLPHRHLFLDALLAAVLMTVLGLASSFFIQALVDYVFVLGQTTSLNWLSMGMLLALAARAAFLALRTSFLAHLSQRIDADVVLGYHEHLLGLPLSFFSTRKTGEILSRMNDAVKIRIAAGATTLSVIVDSTLIAATAAMMLAMNWRATLAPIAMLPILAAVIWLLNSPIKRHQLAAMEKSAEIEALAVETLSGIQTIKAFRAEHAAQTKTEAQFSELLDASLRSQMLAAHGATLTAFAAGLSSLMLLWLGGHLVLAGRMTVGELMALNMMLGMLIAPLDRLASANPAIQDAIVAAERLGETLELEPESQRERRSVLDRRIEGAVEFRGVTFCYPGGRSLFENLDLRIEPGECVGIVGESGCGKTTLVQLLGRFLEPTAGAIHIDGVDLRDYGLPCLRREIGFAPQDIVLFSGGIADNIRLGRPDADAAEIAAAARDARVDRFVERLPNGFATKIGERGLTLSGGERQRIALARAILADPAILVLDEPTSHLDADSELAVQSLIDARRGRRTTIVVSHRPLRFDRTIRLQHAHEESGILAASRR